VAIELRLEPIDCERLRFCIVRGGRRLVDEPMGHAEARRRAAAIGRVLDLRVVEIPATGERITPRRGRWGRTRGADRSSEGR
jgi:hypothetical protein